MYPILFRIGDFEVTSFGLMMLLSFIGGAWMAGEMLKAYRLRPQLIWDMLAWIAVGGIVGAKLYFIALHWRAFLVDPLGLILSREGLVWYGGLMGGMLAYYLQIRSRRLPIGVMFDATAPALLLAIAIGRIGCFLVGDDYGLYTDGRLGVRFPEGIPPSTAGYLRSIGDAIPAGIPNNAVVSVHPTQLYEVAVVLILLPVILWLGKRHLKPGQLFAGFMVLYAIERFLIEFVRAKGDRYVLGLSTSQAISIVLVTAGLVLWQRQRAKPDWCPRSAPPGAALEPEPRRA